MAELENPVETYRLDMGVLINKMLNANITNYNAKHVTEKLTTGQLETCLPYVFYAEIVSDSDSSHIAYYADNKCSNPIAKVGCESDDYTMICGLIRATGIKCMIDNDAMFPIDQDDFVEISRLLKSVKGIPQHVFVAICKILQHKK